MWRTLTAVVLLMQWLSPVMAGAQGLTTSVEGVVFDQTGAGLADVTVVVSDRHTDVTRATVSDVRGHFAVVEEPAQHVRSRLGRSGRARPAPGERKIVGQADPERNDGLFTSCHRDC